jgi:dynein heavy chain
MITLSDLGATRAWICSFSHGTVIDWFYAWPDEALQAVANNFLGSIELPEEHRPQVVQMMVDVHQSMQRYSDRFEAELRRVNSIAPKNFLDFIENYRRQLAQFRAEMGARYKRLDGGLAKLIEAAEDVDKMRVDLTAAKVIVVITTSTRMCCSSKSWSRSWKRT